ncbi:hypothetical protein BHE74_00018456 [Ensete ventricosum]|nr:hypothetical protein BHE74_00018456 [Ensete ventricosum]
MPFDRMPQRGKYRTRTHLRSNEPVRLPKLSAFDKKYAFGHALDWACSSSSPLQSRGELTRILLVDLPQPLADSRLVGYLDRLFPGFQGAVDFSEK